MATNYLERLKEEGKKVWEEEREEESKNLARKILDDTFEHMLNVRLSEWPWDKSMRTEELRRRYGLTQDGYKIYNIIHLFRQMGFGCKMDGLNRGYSDETIYLELSVPKVVEGTPVAEAQKRVMEHNLRVEKTREEIRKDAEKDCENAIASLDKKDLKKFRIPDGQKGTWVNLTKGFSREFDKLLDDSVNAYYWRQVIDVFIQQGFENAKVIGNSNVEDSGVKLYVS